MKHLLVHILKLITIVLICIALSGCSESKKHPVRLFRTKGTPLYITNVPTPTFEVPNYQTIGTYPQFYRQGVNLTKVNLALQNLILNNQRQFSVYAKQHLGFPGSGSGTYETTMEGSFISASSVLVSVLIPDLELYPAGNDGAIWLSATILVPSGKTIQLSDIFTNPEQGIKQLAQLAKTKLIAANSCVKESLANPINGRDFATGFSPTKQNYQFFALTTNGVAIGFPLGQVGFPVCYRQEVTIPYSAITTYLNKLGLELAGAVRAPILLKHS